MLDRVKNTYMDTLKDHENDSATASCIMSYSGRWIAFFSYIFEPSMC